MHRVVVASGEEGFVLAGPVVICGLLMDDPDTLYRVFDRHGIHIKHLGRQRVMTNRRYASNPRESISSFLYRTEPYLELAQPHIRYSLRSIHPTTIDGYEPEQHLATTVKAQLEHQLRGNYDSHLFLEAFAVMLATRLRLWYLQRPALLYPAYGFEDNVGRVTNTHLAALLKGGPIPHVHRLRKTKQLMEAHVERMVMATGGRNLRTVRPLWL